MNHRVVMHAACTSRYVFYYSRFTINNYWRESQKNNYEWNPVRPKIQPIKDFGLHILARRGVYFTTQTAKSI